MIFVADSVYKPLLKQLQQVDQTVLIPRCDSLYEGIRNHADLHVHVSNDQLFISQAFASTFDANRDNWIKKSCIIKETLGSVYPETALLNAISGHNYIFCHRASVSKELLKYASSKKMMVHNVNQGYCRCTTLPLTDNYFITNDPGIHKISKSLSMDSLIVRTDTITLEPFDHGFIGGCAGVIEDMVYFNGDITKHPDYPIILEACTLNKKKLFYIKNLPLNDIGGILHYKNH